MITLFAWWMLTFISANGQVGHGACVWDNRGDAELMANTANENGRGHFSVAPCQPNRHERRAIAKYKKALR